MKEGGHETETATMNGRFTLKTPTKAPLSSKPKAAYTCSLRLKASYKLKASYTSSLRNPQMLSYPASLRPHTLVA